LERFDSVAPADPPGSRLLPDAGLVVLRAGATRVTLDAGALGFGAIAAHGHADALALTISEGSEELICDPGTGSYFGDADLRRCFRGTASHATVLVDGVDQSEQLGPFLWGSRAHAEFIHVDLDQGVAVARHDGYMRLLDPVAHERAIVLVAPAVLVVYDRLRARETHRYSQRWPLAAGLDVAFDGPDVARCGECLVLATASSAPARLRHSRGDRKALEGLWSPRFESVRDASLLALEAQAAGTVHLAALAVTDGSAHVELQLDADGERAEVTAIVDGETFELRLDLDASRPCAVKPVRSELPVS